MPPANRWDEVALRRSDGVPTPRHAEEEDEAEGGVPVTVLVEDAPLDLSPRACNNGLGVPSGRRIDARRADGSHRSHARGYEQYTHDGQDPSGAEEPHSETPGVME